MIYQLSMINQISKNTAQVLRCTHHAFPGNDKTFELLDTQKTNNSSSKLNYRVIIDFDLIAIIL